MMTPSTKDLPGSGTIKLSEIKTEFSKGSNLLDYLGEGGVTSSAPLKLSDFYGASSGISITFPDTAATYSEWFNTGNVPSVSGSADNLDSNWSWSSIAKNSTRTDSAQCGPDTLPNDMNWNVEYDITFTAPRSGAVLSIGAILFASTPQVGHDQYSTLVKPLETILGSNVNQGKYYRDGATLRYFDSNPEGTFRKQGQFTWATASNGPSQIGLFLRNLNNASYGNSNSNVTVHKFKMTSLGRRSMKDRLDSAKPKTLEMSE